MLGIDEYLLPLKHKVCLYMSKPDVCQAPVLSPNGDDPRAPDHHKANFYGTVLHDGGRFRMWYYAGRKVPGGDSGGHRDLPSPTCYAESEDGIVWHKPNLGLWEYEGDRSNNIVMPNEWKLGIMVIKDDVDSDPQRRYKAATTFGATATSPDGLRWTLGPEYGEGLVEGIALYKHDGLYHIASQLTHNLGEESLTVARRGWVSISPDFSNWVEGSALSFWLPEPHAESECRLGVRANGPQDQVHMGVAPMSYGNVLVGLYGLWHHRRGLSNRRVSDYSSVGMEGTSADLGLVIGHDGIHFTEPVKSYPFISAEESSNSSVRGRDPAIPTILCQGNGLLNVGETTYIYHGRWPNCGYPAGGGGEVALATLPRDRWGALGLYEAVHEHVTHEVLRERWGNAQTEGHVWSAPMTLPARGCRFTVNAERANGLALDIADELFDLLPDHSGDRAGTVDVESGLDCPVSWPGGDPAALGGRTVRLRVRFERQGADSPRLYAIYLNAIE